MSSTSTTPRSFLHFGHEACRDSDRSLETEWLETDGTGGYASSTLLACATRRYHGLLVQRPKGSSRRHLFLSRFDELLHSPAGEAAVSMARYPNLFAPRGIDGIESFELAPWPRMSYRALGIELTREILMVRGRGILLCRYSVTGELEGARLELRPLLPFREADALTRENEDLDPDIERIAGGFRATPYAGLPTLSITLDAPHELELAPVWYRGMIYPADETRGYSGEEDQFSPCALRIELGETRELIVAATLGPAVENPALLWREETHDRLRELRDVQEGAFGRSQLAAKAFLYRDENGRPGVDAGYPWFGEWGRDTFIALPGLTLARGEVEACGEVLSSACTYLRDGLIPNVFGRAPDESQYTSADAALWFARAVRMYTDVAGEPARVRDELMPALEEIAEAYWEGTALGIHGDDCGLVSVGGPELNPTWMDAQTASGPVTPRHGFPVEIEALWYSLLEHLVELHADGGDPLRRERWRKLRRRARRAFIEKLWLPDEKRLADGWRDGAADRALRPNMVLAASLAHSPLSRSQRAGVVNAARSELLTPMGLRTLAPSDPGYIPRFEGGPEERDGAYHQGTVWPWLLGPYCEASLRAFGTSHGLIAALGHLWDELDAQLDNAGLNHLSEVFDGDPPHRPGGTIAQAWNTAESLRARAMLARGRP